jgi:hypothetical protein
MKALLFGVIGLLVAVALRIAWLPLTAGLGIRNPRVMVGLPLLRDPAFIALLLVCVGLGVYAGVR